MDEESDVLDVMLKEATDTETDMLSDLSSLESDLQKEADEILRFAKTNEGIQYNGFTGS